MFTVVTRTVEARVHLSLSSGLSDRRTKAKHLSYLLEVETKAALSVNSVVLFCSFPVLIGTTHTIQEQHVPNSVKRNTISEHRFLFVTFINALY